MGRIRNLFRWIPAKEACQGFWSRKQEFVRLPPSATHICATAPTGRGKGTGLIVPHLLTCRDSCVVVDIKNGENARITARHREKVFKHRVVCIDPYRVFTQNPDTLNPLDLIKKDDNNALDACNKLARDICVRPAQEKDPHWNNGAEGFISAVGGVVVQYGEPTTRSLQTVSRIISDPERLEVATKLMIESDCWGGMLARKGGTLRHFVDRERGSVLTTVSTHFAFLNTPAIAESTNSSSFDPRQLRKGGLTVFLILPPNFVSSGLVRTWIGTLMRVCMDGGLTK